MIGLWVAGCVVTVVLTGWLAVLTGVFLRWRRERGEPVYRRLAGGRVRFEWAVATAFQRARHQHPAAPRPTEPDPSPDLPTRPVRRAGRARDGA